MREILFRAWDKNGKGYVNGFNMFGFSTGQGAPERKLQRFSSEWNEKDFELEQFTGLTDKNGTRIFEGDILSDGSEQYTVKYSQLSTGFEAFGNGKEGIWSLYHLANNHNQGREIQIVGNIHDKLAGDTP